MFDPPTNFQTFCCPNLPHDIALASPMDQQSFNIIINYFFEQGLQVSLGTVQLFT